MLEKTIEIADNMLDWYCECNEIYVDSDFENIEDFDDFFTVYENDLIIKKIKGEE